MARGEENKTLKEHVAEIAVQLREAVVIDPEAIQQEYITLPGNLAYYNEQLARFTRLFLFAEIERKAVHGRVWLRQLKEMTQPVADAKGNVKDKAPNADALEAAVNSDLEYIEAREAEASYDAERLRLRGVVDALAAKRDMLVSLGAHLRLEMLQDPTIRNRVPGLEVDEPRSKMT